MRDNIRYRGAKNNNVDEQNKESILDRVSDYFWTVVSYIVF